MLVEGSEPVSLVPISREDVVLIYWMVEGENHGEPWEGVFRLRDGRYLYLIAGCDYTGWDCSAWVSSSLENLVRFGLTQDTRDRFGIDIPSFLEEE